MPVVWTKTYGAGRVFYSSLGHQANIVALPQVLTMMARGMRWAAGEGRRDGRAVRAGVPRGFSPRTPDTVAAKAA